MKIGNVEINGKLVLAPMAGVTDLAFRTICRRMGAAYTVTEMVSAKALCYQDKKTMPIMQLGEGEHPAAVQVFGCDLEAMEKAAAIIVDKAHPDIIDINMGCPMPKVANNGDGSALMRTPDLAARVVEELGLSIPAYGMVKDDRHRTRALVHPDGREIGIQAIPALFALIGQIQEETHRFAIEYHRQLQAGHVKTSVLDQIPGVGPKRRTDLLKHFKTVKAIKAASLAQLGEVVPKNIAQAVYDHFHSEEGSL